MKAFSAFAAAALLAAVPTGPAPALWPAWIERIGWALVHSVWQLAAVALLAALANHAARRCSSNVRYLIAACALGLMLLAPGVTWFCVTVKQPVDATAGRGGTARMMSERVARGPAPHAIDDLGQSLDPDIPDTGERPRRTKSNSTVTRPSRGNIASHGASPSVYPEPKVKFDAEVTGHESDRATEQHAAVWSHMTTWLRAAVEPQLPWLVCFWLAGAGICSVRPICGVWAQWKLRRIGLTPVSEAVLQELSRLVHQMRISRTVRIAQSALVRVPLVVGYLQPVILLPAGVLTGMTPAQLEAVLAHELAHVRRHDWLVNALQVLAETVLFYHPAVWWVSKRIRHERELCCDDLALGEIHDKAVFARALLLLEEMRQIAPAPFATTGLAATGGQLSERIRRLLPVGMAPERTSPNWLPGTILLLTLGIATCLSLLAGPQSNAAPESTDKSNKSNKSHSPDTAATTNSNTSKAVPATRKISIRGKCVDDDKKPVAKVRVRVLKGSVHIDSQPGFSDPFKVISEATSDASGTFELAEIEVPAGAFDPAQNAELFVTATAAGRASFFGVFADELQDVESEKPHLALVLSGDPQTLSGVVTDSTGRHVAGANVFMLMTEEYPIPEIWNAITDQEGRYSINDLARWTPAPPRHGVSPDGSEYTMTEPNKRLLVIHPDYPNATFATAIIPNQVNVTLKPAAFVSGTVMDTVTGKPAASVLVRAKGIGRDEFVQARTDGDGRYRLKMAKDHFSVWVEADDRIAPVLKVVEAVPAKPVTNADIQLVRGAFVVGTVIEETTNRPLVGSPDKPAYVAHYGPACLKNGPYGPIFVGEAGLSIGVQQNTRVNPDGTFRLRVAPGKNCVFFMKTDGEDQQSPQILTLAEGEEKRIDLRVKVIAGKDRPAGINDKYDVLVATTREATPHLSDEDFDADDERFALLRRNARFEDAEAAVKSGKAAVNPISRIPSRQRRDSIVNKLLDKFERQSVGPAAFRDPWLRTIKDIVDLGPAAVPDLIEELDATHDPWIMQLLGFTLRAIDDKRAVPALIRAIPKTLPSPEPEKMSFTEDDFQTYRHPATEIMLSATDPDLRAFAQGHELQPVVARPAENQNYYIYDSPLKEICGALTKLTGAKNGVEELFDAERDGLTSPAQMLSKRQLFQRVADDWAKWWEQNKNKEVAVAPIGANEVQTIETLERIGAHISRDGTSPGNPVTGIWFRNRQKLTVDDLHLLKRFPRLQDLSLPLNVNPPDGGLKIIGELHSLTNLHLANDNRVGNRNIGLGLPELRGLDKLTSLSLVGCDITNEDLQEVGRHTGLTKLHLSGNQIDDAGMKVLRELVDLTELNLRFIKITNAGLVDLGQLKNLKTLDLSGSRITDGGLGELSQLTNLKNLDLSDTRLTGVGFAALNHLQNLTALKLESTRINDAGAKELARFASLTSLRLQDTKITDEGLAEFKQLKNLKYLDVKETNVTAQGCRDLKKSLPNLQIDQ